MDCCGSAGPQGKLKSIGNACVDLYTKIQSMSYAKTAADCYPEAATNMHSTFVSWPGLVASYGHFEIFFDSLMASMLFSLVGRMGL